MEDPFDSRFGRGFQAFVVSGFGVNFLTQFAPELQKSESALMLAFNGTASVLAVGMACMGAAGLKRAITNNPPINALDHK